jgi:hypothetical protein
VSTYYIEYIEWTEAEKGMRIDCSSTVYIDLKKFLKGFVPAGEV